MNITQEDYDIVRKGISKAINGVKDNLENLTRNLDSAFSSLEASKMPEYNKSISAMTKYEIAVKNKIKALETLKE